MTQFQRWGRWLSLALVSVIQVPLFAEQREFPRVLLLAAVAGVGWIARLRARHVFVDRAWARWAVLFAVVMLGEAAQAESFGRSLVGPYEGHQGVLAWCGLLLLVASTPSGATRRDACAALFGLGLLESGIALVQFANDTPPRGTLGHAMFLAILLTLAALAGLGLVLEAESMMARRTLSLGLGFITLVDVLAARRMPLVALALGTGLILSRGSRAKLTWAVGAMVLALLVGAPLHRPESVDYLTQRLTTAFDSSTSYGAQGERRDYYRVALQAIGERPLLGWGFGAFRDLYAQRKAPGIAAFEARVHDLPLELLLALGLLGTLAAVPLAARTARLWRASWDRAPSGTQLACLAAGPAYLLCLLTNFDQPGVAAWGVTLAAFPLLGEPWSPERPQLRYAPALALAVGWLPAALGDALARTGREADAVRVAPFESEYRLRLAQDLRAASPTSTAPERVALLREGLRWEARASFVHEHLAIALADEGQFEVALIERHRSVELAPGYAPFHDGLARALAGANDLSSALNEMNTAIELDPYGAAWHNDRGNVLWHLHRLEEARRDYQAALARDPQNAEAANNLRLLGAP